MHKTHSKTLEMAFKRLYFSKFVGEHAAGLQGQSERLSRRLVNALIL